MVRAPLIALAAGIVCGACAYHATVHPAAPVATVSTGLHCWRADEPIPVQFHGMTVLAVHVQSGMYVLGRHGVAVLIGEIEPGIACVLSEAAEA